MTSYLEDETAAERLRENASRVGGTVITPITIIMLIAFFFLRTVFEAHHLDVHGCSFHHQAELPVSKNWPFSLLMHSPTQLSYQAARPMGIQVLRSRLKLQSILKYKLNGDCVGPELQNTIYTGSVLCAFSETFSQYQMQCPVV